MGAAPLSNIYIEAYNTHIPIIYSVFQNHYIVPYMDVCLTLFCILTYVKDIFRVAFYLY